MSASYSSDNVTSKMVRTVAGTMPAAGIENIGLALFHMIRSIAIFSKMKKSSVVGFNRNMQF